MPRNSKIDIGTPLANLPSERINRLSVQIHWEDAAEIAIVSRELELLDGYLDNVVAHVVKSRKINSESK